MRIPPIALVSLFATPLLCAAVPAVAQLHPPNDSNVSFAGMIGKHPTAPPAPDVAAPPSAWPRLDPGAVLCRTEDDLMRRAAIMRGETAQPADCRPITQATAIQIVQRAGLGRTEVKLTARDETGWTDAWLPGTPPPGSTPINAGSPVGATRASAR
jgi:hypothetical protein